MKVFLLLVFIAILGTFIYIKIQVVGSPDSTFNQTSRYTLGKHPVLRTIFGLHGSGDARAEFFGGTGPIIVEWFEPQDDNIDSSLIQKLADAAGKYTGRQDQVMFAGYVDESTIDLSNLVSYQLKSAAQYPSGGNSILLVFVTEDYSPRASDELSSTYKEDGMVLSLNAHTQFISSFPQDLDSYLYASMLHELGNQLGLPETTSNDTACIMNLHAGYNGQPLEIYGKSEPTDFCPSEQALLTGLKAEYGQ